MWSERIETGEIDLASGGAEDMNGASFDGFTVEVEDRKSVV